MDDEDAREAVRRYLDERGELSGMHSPSTWTCTPHVLVRAAIVRCVESRDERTREGPGVADPPDLPLYDDLAKHHIDPPRDLETPPPPVELVKRGSASVGTCPGCTGGQVVCSRCSGSTEIDCPERVVCDACQNNDSCLSCRAASEDGPPKEPAGRPGPGRAHRTCLRCERLSDVCSTCLGKGDIPCPVCHGGGRQKCPECRRTGMVTHERCAGTGLVTTWVEGVVSWKRETRTGSWRDDGVSWWAWTRARWQGDWHRRVHHRSARRREGSGGVPEGGAGDGPGTGVEVTELPADFDGKPPEGLLSLVRSPAGEVASRLDLRWLPLVRVAVPVHPHRVYYVHRAEGTPRVFALLSSQRVLQFAAAASVALALLGVAWWLLATYG